MGKVVVHALGAALLATCGYAPAAWAQPYPASSAITDVTFDFATHVRLAPGSDNWPITWADDGHLYGAWGDGGGFGGTNQNGRVSLGLARIEGPFASHQGFNVWGGFNPENLAQFEGKSYGILSVGGTLYMWVSPDPKPHLTESRIAYSTDYGASWQQASWAFTFADELTIPTFLNFGQDYAGARDGFVYSYYIRPQYGPGESTDPAAVNGFHVHAPGELFLSRVPGGEILTEASYEFFAGLDAGNQPLWTSDPNQKQPVFRDDNGVGWNVSASYNAGLSRYLLMTEHSLTHQAHLGMFDGPEPWGPWTTVAYIDAFGSGAVELTSFYWNFANKWASADGRTFKLVFTGRDTNDSWNVVEGTFEASGTGPTPSVDISNTQPSSYVWDNLAVGKLAYVDRAFTFTDVATSYVGLDYLRTANDDKLITADSHVTFDLGEPATVYVAHDDRVGDKPSWLLAFADTGDDLLTEDATLSLFAQDYDPGPVVLGGNAGVSSSSMYVVVARAVPAGSGGGGGSAGSGGGGLAPGTDPAGGSAADDGCGCRLVSLAVHGEDNGRPLACWWVLPFVWIARRCARKHGRHVEHRRTAPGRGGSSCPKSGATSSQLYASCAFEAERGRRAHRCRPLAPPRAAQRTSLIWGE